MKRQLLPPPASGVHGWLFGRAVYLRREGFDLADALAELRAHVTASTFRAGRSVTDREIVQAVASAYRAALAPAPLRHDSINTVAELPVTDYDAATGWPAEMPLTREVLNRPRLNRILRDAGTFELVDLWSASPVRPPDDPAPKWALQQLFNDSDVLCIGASSSNFAAKPLCEWTDAELLTGQLLVPNPLRKISGTTKAGTASAHSRDATGQRRYVIVESDAGLSLDDQAKVLEHLRTFTNATLAAVVLSGGKSAHGFFRCDGVPIDQLRDWFDYAVSLGADPRLWLPEQFCRLPDGLRDTGARQTLLFINPTPS